MKNLQMPKLQAATGMAQLRADMLWKSVMVWLAGLVFTTLSLVKPLPAMALPYHHTPDAMAVASQSTVAAIPNKVKATAKDAEGKLESAYGDITGDAGRQIKGKAKQVQASAMNAGEDLKEGAKSVAKKVGDATR
jgi:uncharacterized protein YjbJ (UPF0337 family)